MTRKFTFLLMALLALAGFKSWGQENVLSEGFESSTFPPDGWTTIHVAGDDSWTRYANTFHEGTACARVDDTYHDDYLITPQLTPQAGESLSFYLSGGNWVGYDGTTLTVEVSTTDTDASSFTTVLNTYISGGSATMGATFANKIIDLSAFVGQNIYIAFHAIVNNGSEVLIDDVTGVSIAGVITCPAPTGLAASNITAEGATISWTSNDAESYDLAYGVASTFDLENPSTYAVQNTTATSVQLSGLTAETEYKCAVRSHCDAEDVSAWSSAVSFLPTAKMTLTINESSSNYNDRVPFQGYNADGLTKSQFIIPAASLTALEGADITALDFYTTTSGSNVGPADYTFYGSWDVYFKIVDYVIMPFSYESSDGMDKVYTGNMVISNNKMTLTFDEPYTYEGGNLMIYFNQTQRTSYKSTYWRGVTTSEYAARAGYVGSYSSDNANYYFLPTTTFTYIPGSTTEYTVNLHVNGVVTEETITSMPAAPTAPAGLTFCGWTTSDITTYVTDAPTYVTSLSDEITDLYAVFSYTESVPATSKDGETWVKVTNASDLQAGDEIVLVYNNLIMCTRGDAGWEDYPVADVTISNSEITYLPENAAQFTLIANNGYWNLEYNELGATRILATNSSNNELASKDLYELWYPTYMSIDFTATTNGNSVLFYNSDTYMYIHYRSDWSQITTSNGSSTTYACQAYKKYIPVITTNYYMTSVLTRGTVANATFKNIIVVNPITVSGRLEMNAGGLFRNENTANFVFEDGAQFYYTGTENVKATFQKSITGYGTSEKDNYYLIANPTNVTTVTNLVNENGYDLYTFNPAQAFEWNNEKENNALTSGKGYLYANITSTTLGFAGELNPATSRTFELTYAEEGQGIDFPNFNLVGNPFACNAYCFDRNFYKIDGIELQVSDDNFFAPCEGVFVEAAFDEDPFTIQTTANLSKQGSSSFSLNVNQNDKFIDRAIVNFDGRNDLHKFMLNPAHTNISLAKHGEEFAAISSEAEGEIPVNFKAEKNGTYTISVDTKNVETNYLHLIDNLTGMDVDLLANDSYTFNASTSDYAYRFRLVFSMTGVNEDMSNDSSFAYISNGNLVINNIEGEASLQIVDMLGRIVSTETVSGSYNKALDLNAGLYIINLNGMTQKIVVK